MPDPGSLIQAGRNNPPTVRRRSHRPDPTRVTVEGEQFLAAGRLPHDGRAIITARNNPLAVWRKGHRADAVPAENRLLQVTLPLPIEPFEITVRKILDIFQQLPQPTDVLLPPGILGQVHVGHVKEAVCNGFLLLGLERLFVRALFLNVGFGLGFLGAHGLPGADHRAHEQRSGDRRGGSEGEFVPPNGRSTPGHAVPRQESSGGDPKEKLEEG